MSRCVCKLDSADDTVIVYQVLHVSEDLSIPALRSGCNLRRARRTLVIVDSCGLRVQHKWNREKPLRIRLSGKNFVVHILLL